MNRFAKILVGFLVCTLACSFFLPSISRVRMTANRVYCQNNMKQQGFALRNYHDSFRSFPPGTIPNEAPQPGDRLSWLVTILPFIEQDNLYGKINRGQAWNSPENKAMKGEVKELHCPESAFYGNFQFGSYVGMAGLGKDAALLASTHPKAGVFGYDRMTRLNEVTDGASTTIMVVETNFENGPWSAGGFPSIRGLDTNGPDYLGSTGQFGSLHRTKESTLFKVYVECSNCTFVDGSVRFLAKTIDSKTFEALATIAGGERVELPVDY